MTGFQFGRKDFRIGNVTVLSDLILAPMDGITDQPFRRLARRMGSGASYTEFINALDVIRGHPLLERRIAFNQEERPIAFQLFDDDPDRLLQAAIQLQERTPDFIDINMGCPARTVAGRGAGVALMRSPHKVADIFSRLSRILNIPVTCKMRLGWDDASRNYLEIARIVEDNGGSCIAVHARTKAQAYTGAPDWEAIAQIKQAVHIPVIGNGDVRSPADIDRIKKLTGCDAVMIGRAAVENPWLFSRQDRAEVHPDQVLTTMHQHLDLMMETYPMEVALILFRKFAKGYLQPYKMNRSQLGSLLTTTSTGFFWAEIEKIILDGIPEDKKSVIGD